MFQIAKTSLCGCQSITIHLPAAFLTAMSYLIILFRVGVNYFDQLQLLLQLSVVNYKYNYNYLRLRKINYNYNYFQSITITTTFTRRESLVKIQLIQVSYIGYVLLGLTLVTKYNIFIKLISFMCLSDILLFIYKF